MAPVKRGSATLRLLASLPRPPAARAGFSSATEEIAGSEGAGTNSRGNPADAALLQQILRRALVAEVGTFTEEALQTEKQRQC